MTPHQEKQLFHRIATEETLKSFNLFFELYHTRLLRFAALYVGSVEDAEDVVSEVLITMLSKRHEVFLKDDFLSYLFRCVKNRCLDQLKKDRRRQVKHELSASEKDYFSFHTQAPDSQLMYSELDGAIRDCIEQLPPKRRMVFRFIKDDGLSQKEVAELMGISPRTVEVHLRLAVKELRTVVEAHQNDKQHASFSILRVAKVLLPLLLFLS